MTEFISLDPGSSYMKAAAPGGTCVRFPSLLTRCAEGAGIGVAGQWYAVGEDAVDAQAKVATDPQAGSAYHGSPEQHVLLCEALRRLGLGGGEVLEGVIIGMPYVLSQDAAALAAMRDACRVFAWREPGGAERRVEVEACYFPPQGGGALWAHMHALAAEGEALRDRVVCVVDIGGQTTDVVTVRYGDRLGDEQRLPWASASVGVNVHDFYLDLVEDLSALPYADTRSRHFDYYGLMRRIERGETTLPLGPRRSLPLTDSVQRTRRIWTERLERAVRRVIGTRWHEITQVLLTGGGAHLVDTDIWGEPVAPSDDLANVRGQLLCIQNRSTSQ